jgi:hypothetical protein
MKVREEAYTFDNILHSWRRSGLTKNSSEIALATYKGEQHYDVEMPKVRD